MNSCCLREMRGKRRLAAAELARQAGVSRQTIYAIEDGSFIPNTTIALKLARALDCSVEDLFSLAPDEPVAAPLLADLLDPQHRKPVELQLVNVLDTGKGAQAMPADAAFHFLPDADGVLQPGRMQRPSVTVAQRDPRASVEALLIAGCDPALSLLANQGRANGIAVSLIPASSEQSLHWLRELKVQIAGSHLLDARSGEYNSPAVRRLFPKRPISMLTFAHWQSGLVTQANNPKQIRAIADLGQPDITIVNREKGSAGRAHLDNALKSAGIERSRIAGYDRVAYGHLPAAFAVANGWADCCLATQSAARCFGLNFVPLWTERFDLVLARTFLKTPNGELLADLLNRSNFRQKLRAIAGYDSTHTGELVA